MYRREADGHLHPYLVTSISIHRSKYPGGDDTVSIGLLANGGTTSLGSIKTSVAFTADKISRKKPADVFLAAGLFRETAELKMDYLETVETYRKILPRGFSEQYRYNGTPLGMEDHTDRTPERVEGRKVVHDITPQEIPAFAEHAPSVLHSDDDETEGTGSVPIRPSSTSST